MSTICENRFCRKSILELICAAIYVLSICVLPFTHTCTSTESEGSYCHLGDATSREEGSRHDDGEGESSSEENSCKACLYSVNSKTCEVGSGIVLATCESSTLSGPVQISQSLKQDEWTSSVFLRAPPLNIS